MRTGLTLAVLVLPALIVSLDLSVLLVALPEIARDLGADTTQQLWITDVYGFAVAGFLVSMGTLGDRIGRRRLLLVGGAAFGLASLGAAFAPTPELLIAARALLGVAGATLMPSVLGIVSVLYPDDRQRGAAIAVVFGAIMVGGSIGPALGGVILSVAWWGAVFLPGVAVMVLLLVAGPRVLPEHRATDRAASADLDVVSVALSLLALLPLVHGGTELTRGHVGGLAWVALGLGAGVAFVARQRRLPRPLLDLRLFGHRALRGALAVMLVGGVVMGGTFLVVTQYLQLVAGLSPFQAGIATMPATLAMLGGVLAGPALAARWRPATVMAAGTALAAAGLVAVAAAPSLPALLGGFTVALFGMGLPGSLGIGAVLGSAPPEQAGSASALSETAQELGMALGLAAIGGLAGAAYRVALGPAPEVARAGIATAHLAGGQVLLDAQGAYADALTATMLVAAALLAGLAVVAARTLAHLPRLGTRVAGAP